MTTTYPNNDAFELLFQTTAQTSFNMTPYDWQRRLGGQILRLRADREEVRQLCIQPTGGGKTLVFHTLACYMKGVSICIIPLLSLGADQVNKAMLRARHDPSIWAVHLDDLRDIDVKELLGLINEMDQATTTVMLYSSPQFLVQRFPGFLSKLINTCAIKLVVVDEIHLFAQFGRSFRSEFNDMNEKFFRLIPKKTPMLFLTATCTKRIKASFETAIGLPITHVWWPSARNMIDRKVSLFVSYSSRPFSNMSKSIALMLKEETDLPSKFIVYSNVRSRIKDVKESLCLSFDKDDKLFEKDVICIHGQLSKEEKSRYTQIFLNPELEEDESIKVLCATSGVGNVGIDSPDIRGVFRLEFPPSIMDLVQEKGRAGRRPIADPSNFGYTLYFSIESYLYIFERTMNPKEKFIDESYRQAVINDALEVAQMFSVHRKCYYVALEEMLGNPYLEIDRSNDALPPCAICPFCRKEKLFPIINRPGTERVLFDIFHPQPQNGLAVETLPMTLEAIVKLIREYKDARFLITKSKAATPIPPDIVKKVLFLLLAAQILTLHYHQEEEKAVFALSRSANESSTFALHSDEFWNNIDLK